MPSRNALLAPLMLCSALAFATLTGAPAQAVVVGTLVVGPTSGTDETLFHGSITDAQCPAGTADSYFSIDGPDLPRDVAILAPGNATGSGPQSFQGASIANIKSTSTGSFARSGTYTIRFNCVRSPDGVVTNTYERAMTYRTAGAGSFTLNAAPRFSPPPPRPSSAPTPSATSTPTAAGSSAPDRLATSLASPAGVRGAEGVNGTAADGAASGGSTGGWAALGAAIAAVVGVVVIFARRRRRSA